MKLKRAAGVISCLCVVILLAACQSTLPAGDNVKTSHVGPAIDNTVWELVSYHSVSGTMDPKVEKSIVNFKIAEGKITGNAGANRFFGEVELDGSSIRVSATGSTMMMGTPELMAQENQVLKLLQHTVTYQIVEEELRLKNAEGKVVLVFKSVVEPALTSNVWRATGINNGNGGVVSLLADTEVTARFDESGTVSGSSGCNKFTGSYEISGNSLKIGPLAGTRKMCAKPEGIMEQEANVLRALEKATTFNIDENALKLRDESGSLQIKFMLKEQ